MYDVAPFLPTVPAQPERSIDLVDMQADQEVFRASRAASSVGDMMREYLGIK